MAERVTPHGLPLVIILERHPLGRMLTFSALDDGAQPLAVVLLHQDFLQLAGDDPYHRRLVLLAVGAACRCKDHQGVAAIETDKQSDQVSYRE